MLNVKTVFGEPFEVDTSNEVCAKFNLRHGARVIIIDSGIEGTFIGVAPINQKNLSHIDVPWFIFDDDDGRVRYFYPINGKIKPLD